MPRSWTVAVDRTVCYKLYATWWLSILGSPDTCRTLVAVTHSRTVCCLGYDDQSSHTTVIRANYVFLLETLDVKFSGLVGQLYSDHVVSAVERDDITAEKTSFRANEKLLSALSRKSPQQFQLFLDALDNCGQRHVRNVITGPQGFQRLSHTQTT